MSRIIIDAEELQSSKTKDEIIKMAQKSIADVLAEKLEGMNLEFGCVLKIEYQIQIVGPVGEGTEDEKDRID